MINAKLNILLKYKVNKSNLELDSPSNFSFDLSQPLKNVEIIQLNDVQIPRAWYVFDNAYGTNSFEYNNTVYTKYTPPLCKHVPHIDIALVYLHRCV